MEIESERDTAFADAEKGKYEGSKMGMIKMGEDTFALWWRSHINTLIIWYLKVAATAFPNGLEL